MIHDSFHHWPMSEREKRLCPMCPPAPSGAPSSAPGAAPGSSPGWLQRQMNEVQSFSILVWEKISGIDAERRQQIMNTILAFRESAPSLANVVKDKLQNATTITVEQIQKLTDHTHWLDTLDLWSANPAAFVFEPQAQALTKLRDGTYPANDAAKMILSSLDAAGRSMLFVRYIDDVIPPSAQEQAINGRAEPDRAAFRARLAIGQSPENRFNTMDRGVVLNAVRGTLGVGVPSALLNVGTDAGDLARTALRQRFFETRNGASVASGQLLNEYRHASQALSSRLGSTGVTNVAQLSPVLALSHLKGALNLGLVDNTMLQNLTTQVREADLRRAVEGGDAQRGLEGLLGSVGAEVQQNREGLAEFWNNLGPYWKLAAIAAILYGAMKNKGIAATVVIGALGLKYFGADQVIGDFTRQSRRNVLDSRLTNPNLDAAERERIGGAYLNSGPEGPAITNEIMAFGLVMDLKMSDIVDHFRTGGEQSTWVDFDAIFPKLQEAMSRRPGWRSDFRQFFSQETPEGRANRTALADVVSFTFVKEAINADRGVNAHQDLIDIVKRPAGLGSGISFKRFANLPPDIQSAYRNLVLIGQRRLGVGSLGEKTLGTVILEATGGLSTVPSENPEVREKQVRERLLKLATDLGITCDASLADRLVLRYGTYRFDVFQSMLRDPGQTAETLFAQWKTAVASQKQAQVRSALPGPPNWTVIVAPDGTNVQVQRGSERVATVPLLAFLSITRLSGAAPSLLTHYNTFTAAGAGATLNLAGL